MADGKVVRIGGGSGFWGDTSLGPAQLFAQDNLDYVVLDYLAEVTMSILAKAKAKAPEAGYALDFVTEVMRPHIHAIAEKKIRIVTNAGGLNPAACRRALERLAAETGVELKIGLVLGDDLNPRFAGLRNGLREIDSGMEAPEAVLSANAYLGAFPIARALDLGADIVITGRCVDSALALGPLIHEFGWRETDYDRLAAGSLVGHLIECGAQASGGNFTDWEIVADGWENAGFPICEVSGDGAFVITKPEGTGGAVTALTAAEQMIYEIGDPARYLLPDVVCDFGSVRMETAGPNRVRVSGARGSAPTTYLKACATYADGYSCVGAFAVAGENAVAKARRHGEAVLARTAGMLAQRQLPPFTATNVAIVGEEALFGDADPASVASRREAVLRLAVQHPSIKGADLFSREFVGSALTMAPGVTLLSPGRPKASPVVRLYSFLIEKAAVAVDVEVGVKTIPAPWAECVATHAALSVAQAPPRLPDGERFSVPLRRLAVARGGDKGDKANIGVVARKPEYLPWIRAQLTPERVAERFASVNRGRVERFDLPGVDGLNFLLHNALGGGGAASIHLDAQAKTYAQALLDALIPVSAEIARAALA